MMTKGLCELSALLDDVINFAARQPTPDELADWKKQGERMGDKHRAAILAGVGVAGTGAAGYGLYKRGQAMGRFTMPFSKGPRSKGVISTPKSRGIIGNIVAGAARRAKK
jgi:hypothetical protein